MVKVDRMSMTMQKATRSSCRGLTGLRLVSTIATGLATLVLGSPARAAGGCSISTNAVVFGAYNTVDATAVASTGKITYACARSAQAKTVVIWINKGAHAPTNNPRQMASGSNRLNYNLYLDANHTAIWGDPNPNQYAFAPANGVTYEIPVYGLIPALQDLPNGVYADSLVVTLNW
jgi:spore coat protein U-like protein